MTSKSHRCETSVVVVVTPDAGNLEELSLECIAEIAKFGGPYEILFVIGSAANATIEQARGLSAQDPEHVRVLRVSEALGRAEMLAAGVRYSQGDVIVTLPDHFVVDLQVLSELRQALDDRADLAFASRGRRGIGGLARIQSAIFNRLLSFASGSRYRDIASGTRVFRRQVAEETPLYGDLYRYLPLLAERLGFRVAEVTAIPHKRMVAPLLHAPRIYLWRAIDLLSIFFISRFTRYPLRLFGGVGAVSTVLGLVVLCILSVQRMQGTPLANRPLLVLAALFIGLGVQVFTIGLLGELILFFQARHVRDYRISAVYESDRPAPLGGAPDGSSQG